MFRFLPLSDVDLAGIVTRIAKGEKLSLDADAVNAVVAVSEGDARKAANVLQGSCSAATKVKPEDIYRVASRAAPKEVSDLVSSALGGDFIASRKLLLDTMAKYGLGGEEVLLSIYREVTNLAIPDQQKVLLVDKIGEYSFRMIMGADEGIQLEALLAQLVLLGGKKN